MELKDKLLKELEHIDSDIKVYTEYLKNKDNNRVLINLVGFKIMYESWRFAAIANLTEDFTPTKEQEGYIKNALIGAINQVNITNGKVDISSDVQQLAMAKMESMLKTKENGKEM